MQIFCFLLLTLPIFQAQTTTTTTTATATTTAVNGEECDIFAGIRVECGEGIKDEATCRSLVSTYLPFANSGFHVINWIFWEAKYKDFLMFLRAAVAGQTMILLILPALTVQTRTSAA